MLDNLKILSKRYGAAKGLNTYCNMKFNTSGKLKIPNVKHPIHFKPKSIDVYTIIEIFGLDCYNLSLNFTPRLIIDAGANIGLASVYLANKYPEAKIIAIEPESNNYKQLLDNIKPYKNIKSLQSAIWNKSCFVEIKDNGFGTRGFMIEESTEDNPNSFKAISIDDLIEDNQNIDILKIDIEGGEKYLFEKNYENWLPKTKCIIVEFHENMIEGSSKPVLEAIKKYNFSSYQKEENTIFINEDLL